MKHGVAFRKLGRTSAHRMLMLRNLVTSLIEHEQVKTTLPKAKEAARLAEKLITMGKQGDLPAARRASAFLLKQELLPKVFETIAQRYADREGGYTRIHKFGHRPGDNAPHAILELVDNPRDLKLDLTARAIGWEIYGHRLRGTAFQSADIRNENVIGDLLKDELLASDPSVSKLREKTRWNLQKVLHFRSPDMLAEFGSKVRDYILELIAKPQAHQGIRSLMKPPARISKHREKLVLAAGQRTPAQTISSLGIASGRLGTSWENRRKMGIAHPS